MIPCKVHPYSVKLYSTVTGCVVAMYPSPAGATESELHFESWSRMVSLNPVLADLEPKPESKKPTKGKLTSDGADAGTKDRAGDEPAPVAEAADGAAEGKA